MRLKKYISLVFGFLNERAEYAVLRNYQGLPDDNSSRDIDIIISKRCFREIKRELVECICQEGWRIVTYLNSDRLITFVCAKNVGNETEIVQWDFFVNTSVWGVQLMSAEEFVEHRVWNGFLWHVDVVGEFLDKYLYNRAVGEAYPAKYEAIRLQITDNSQQDSLCSLVLSPTDDTDNTDLNSSGSAMAEHAKWSESLEARLNKLKATWQSLSQTFLSSDFLKGGLDFITGFVNAIDALMNKFGTLQTLLGGYAVIKLFSTLIGGFSTLNGMVRNFSDILPALGAIFPNLGMAVTRFTLTLTKSGSAIAAFKAALAGLSGLQLASLGIAAAVAVIGGAIWAFDACTESAKELAERVEEVTSRFKEQQSELVKGKSSFKSEATKYVQLAKGVDELGRNVSLTADEYSEYQSIVNNIADNRKF